MGFNLIHFAPDPRLGDEQFEPILQTVEWEGGRGGQKKHLVYCDPLNYMARHMKQFGVDNDDASLDMQAAVKRAAIAEAVWHCMRGVWGALGAGQVIALQSDNPLSTIRNPKRDELQVVKSEIVDMNQVGMLPIVPPLVRVMGKREFEVLRDPAALVDLIREKLETL